jgi:hypothetical protein
MLTGYMALISIAVALIYAVLDVSNGVYYALPAYSVILFMPLVSLWLIRKKKYNASKVVLLLSANLVVFWTALNDPFETGVFLFFIPASISSFVLLSFNQYKLGILFTGVTTILFLVAYFGDFHPFEIPSPSSHYIKISFTFNYFISIAISVLAIYFLTNLNRTSENELIQKESLAFSKNIELQKVNEELDRFVYSVSHDLRSPLSSILGLIHLARLTNDPVELESILTMIQGRVHAQDHFIREIIDYSRNARTELITEPIPLKQLVDEVFESLRFNINADKITFRPVMADDLVIYTDRVRLTIIISNLIGNAIKYHDFRKEEPFIEIGFHKDKSAIYVQDNGIGIMTEHQPKIFNMFYRGSDRSTGSGLGLFITKEAVAKLHGSIEVTSVLGEGSTFTVTLPQLQTS